MKYSLFLALLLAFLLSSCGRDGQNGRYELDLEGSIFNQLEDRVQLRLDTIVGDSAAIIFDSLSQKRFLLRSFHNGQFARNYNGNDTLVVGSIDSLPGKDNIVRLTNNHRVKVDIPAVDVVLKGDSIRLGVMHILGSAFTFGNDSYVPDPDQLIITSWGRDNLPFAMDQENIGPVTRQTVFRVGRNHYYIESVDVPRRKMTIKELDRPGSLPVTAEFDLKFKRVSVDKLDGETTTIGPQAGRKFALYFWSIGSFRSGEGDVVSIDSIYNSLSRDKRSLCDIYLVNRNDEAPAIRKFIAENNIKLPVYMSTANTCRKLNCRPDIPYWVGVNERGRVVSFYNETEMLAESLRKL